MLSGSTLTLVGSADGEANPKNAEPEPGQQPLLPEELLVKVAEFLVRYQATQSVLEFSLAARKIYKALVPVLMQALSASLRHGLYNDCYAKALLSLRSDSQKVNKLRSFKDAYLLYADVATYRFLSECPSLRKLDVRCTDPLLLWVLETAPCRQCLTTINVHIDENLTFEVDFALDLPVLVDLTICGDGPGIRSLLSSLDLGDSLSRLESLWVAVFSSSELHIPSGLLKSRFENLKKLRVDGKADNEFLLLLACGQIGSDIELLNLELHSQTPEVGQSKQLELVQDPRFKFPKLKRLELRGVIDPIIIDRFGASETTPLLSEICLK